MIDLLRTQLPTWSEVRAVALAYRRGSLPEGWLRVEHRPDTEPDEELLAPVTEPFDSVGDAYERLERTERHLRERSDRRSVFLTVYTEMTNTVRRGIESGAFEDPTWVRSYTTAFANRYRAALVDFERGNRIEVPVAWQIGFHASTSNYTLLLQDAVLGINAHINYDLPFTLCDVSIDPDRSGKARDHDRINGILARLVDVVQRALADVYEADGYRHVDALLGSFDEDFTLLGLTEARSLAWRNAVMLTDTRRPVVRRFVEWRVTLVSAGAGYFILAPSADRSVLWALRRLEGDDPPLDRLGDAFRRRSSERDILLESTPE